MASTTAMFTGLTGLSANARWLDVTGNNVANINTTAFKGSRMLFSNAISRTLSAGTPPAENSGGTNPKQIGFGTLVAGTQRDFTGGAISPTGDGRDLAIEGSGLFVVRRGDQEFFTRAGAFRPNAENQLTNVSGERLRGYGVDESFGIVRGELVDLTIPVGSLTIADQTREVRFNGNLNAAGDLPTQGSLISLNALSLLSGPVGANALETTSLLTQIESPGGTGNPLFQTGQSLQIAGATKGTKTIPSASLPITASSTVQDLMDFLRQALGINTGAGNNPDGRAPGVTLDQSTGVISIVGNIGTISDLSIDPTDLRVLDSSGTVVRQPFTPQKLADSDGESVRTTMLVFDSRGNPITADLSFVLDQHSETGSSWRWFSESADDSDIDLTTGTGTLEFDVFGQPLGATTGQMTLNRLGTGAADPLTITLNFSADGDGLTSLADVASALAATYQDGSPIGTLATFSFGDDGVITGSFTNGLTRTLGQVAIAKFANDEGLVDVGGNLFLAGANSGEPIITEPLQLGAGRLISGALELSNVDLSQEFINMILASTGYSASSRVITTTDQLMQQLLVLGR